MHKKHNQLSFTINENKHHRELGQLTRFKLKAPHTYKRRFWVKQKQTRWKV